MLFVKHTLLVVVSSYANQHILCGHIHNQHSKLPQSENMKFTENIWDLKVKMPSWLLVGEILANGSSFADTLYCHIIVLVATLYMRLK